MIPFKFYYYTISYIILILIIFKRCEKSINGGVKFNNFIYCFYRDINNSTHNI